MYLLDIFDSITKKNEFMDMTSGQLMPKRPKLADRRAKRRKEIPDPNTNQHIVLPKDGPAPRPMDVSTRFNQPHWQTLIDRETGDETNTDDPESELYV
jgi:hypothetical protein